MGVTHLSGGLGDGTSPNGVQGRSPGRGSPPEAEAFL